MAALLNSDGINYTVFLKAYSCSGVNVNDVEGTLKCLLGHNVAVDSVRDCDLTEVSNELSDCLGYAGDDGSGPGPRTLGQSEYSTLLKEIISNIAQVSFQCNGMKSFRIVDGHPAYPVFWEFAFLFIRNDVHHLLVGAASD